MESIGGPGGRTTVINSIVSAAWNHRLILMVLLVSLCIVAISAGRRVHNRATLDRVQAIQLGLNSALAEYRAGEDVPDLVKDLPEMDAARLISFVEAGGQFQPAAPDCQRPHVKSVIGPNQQTFTCRVDAQPLPEQIACQTELDAIHPVETNAFPVRACLVTVWQKNDRDWTLAWAAFGQMSKDDPSEDGSSFQSSL